MPCPTCGHEMTWLIKYRDRPLGERCPSCGTLRTPQGVVITPKLVEAVKAADDDNETADPEHRKRLLHTLFAKSLWADVRRCIGRGKS